MTTTRAALVTGCSSGIGEATARALADAGYRVYATARDVSRLRGLASADIVPLALDVTDEDAMKQAVARITAAHGHVEVLVNNAGYGLLGPAEEAPADRVRDQFEVNFFGLVRLTQLVLPGMREHGSGTVVNLSSVFGRMPVPGGAFYTASKHALEAYSEALRLETAPFGVRVALVEPGPVKTAFGDAALATLAGAAGSPVYEGFRAELAGWYRSIYQGADKKVTGRNVAGLFAVEPRVVAATVVRAANARRTRARYPVGFLARMLLMLRRYAPQPVFERFVRFQFPVPRR